MIDARDLTKTYPLGKVDVSALRGVSLTIREGEFIALAGPSGSGKTTLLNILGCIEKPTAGKVLFDDQDVSALPRNQLADLRARSLGFIFQSFNLLPVLDAAENVEFPLTLKPASAKERRERACEALERVGLKNFIHHRPNEMSGGQRQRVAIARAIAPRPRLVLADEPTANLDQATGQEVIELMRNLNAALGTTFVICSHDPRVIEATDRVIHLEDGRLAEQP